MAVYPDPSIKPTITPIVGQAEAAELTKQYLSHRTITLDVALTRIFGLDHVSLSEELGVDLSA